MKYLLFFITLFYFCNSTAQNLDHPPIQEHKKGLKLGIQKMGLVLHTFKTSRPDRYTLKLDPWGFFVYTPGVVINVDWYYKTGSKYHLRFAGGYYKDSGFNNAAYIHAAWRRRFFPHKKWEITAGLGPALFVRDNWNHVYPDRYQNDPFYGNRATKNGLYQYRFFPLGGELDFIYHFNKKLDLDVSIIPAIPAAVIMKIGLRFQL